MNKEQEKHLFNSDIRFKEIRIGLFSLIALVLLTVAVVMVGGGVDFWEKKAVLKLRLPSVEGLKSGSPVMIGGIQAGKVKKMNFVQTKKSFMSELTLEIKESRLIAIRQDSVANIKTRGLMGDHYIEIALGSLNLPKVHSGDTLTIQKGASMDDLTLQAVALTNHLSNLSAELEKIAGNISSGKGTLGELAVDPALYNRASSLVDEIEHLIGSIKKHPKKYFKFSVF